MIKRLKVIQTEDHEYLGYGWSLKTRAKRMSGDLTTSLGNGISNLLLMLFVADEMGVEIHGFVEGDDGLFGVVDPPDGFEMPGPQYFERLGMELKIDFVENACTASFCGNIFHPDSLRNITDPIQKILKMGWCLDQAYFDARGEVLLSIQRAAALSLAAGYVGCPILSAYARMLLRLTSGREPKFGDAKNVYTWDELWEMGGDNWRSVTQDRVNARVRYCDRLLLEQEYGISVSDQLELEQFFDTNVHMQWTCPSFAKYVPKVHFIEHDRQICGRHFDPLVCPRL
jgi:hypothetical protein